jgi:hypothetical protein
MDRYATPLGSLTTYSGRLERLLVIGDLQEFLLSILRAIFVPWTFPTLAIYKKRVGKHIMED